MRSPNGSGMPWPRNEGFSSPHPKSAPSSETASPFLPPLNCRWVPGVRAPSRGFQAWPRAVCGTLVNTFPSSFQLASVPVSWDKHPHTPTLGTVFASWQATGWGEAFRAWSHALGSTDNRGGQHTILPKAGRSLPPQTNRPEPWRSAVPTSLPRAPC